MPTAKEQLVLEARKKLEHNILLFSKFTSPGTHVVKSPSFHYELAEIYENPRYNRVNIIAPRGHAKSSLAKAMALHHLEYGPTKIKFILLVSKTQDHAIRLLNDIKSMIEYSPGYREVYGYKGKETARTWSKEEVELSDGSVILTRGASQQIVGLNHLGQRPTLVIYDDPEDHKNTLNKEQMEKTLRILMKDVEPCVDPMHGRIFVIGTPQREGCLIEKIKDMPNWITKHYDAIIDENKKKVLWPEWLPWDKLMEKKAAYEAINKLSIFYSEYRCQIISDEDQLFTPGDFRYWDGEFFFDESKQKFIKITHLGQKVKEELDWVVSWQELKEPIVEPVNVFMGVDPASSISDTADYSVIMPIAVDKNKKCYVLPFYRKRVKPMELAKAIIHYFQMYKPEKTNIETVGYQEMLRDYLKNESNVYIPGMEIKNNVRSPKSKRIETLQPFFYNKQILFKRNMPNLDELESELLLYPRSSHDDTLDGLFYAKKSIYIPTHEYGKKPVVIKRHQVLDGWAVA